MKLRLSLLLIIAAPMTGCANTSSRSAAMDDFLDGAANSAKARENTSTIKTSSHTDTENIPDDVFSRHLNATVKGVARLFKSEYEQCAG